MAPQEIHKQWKQRPFMPFKLHVADGTSYEVLDPADIIVDMLRVYVGIKPDESGLFTTTMHISPSHVSRIEPLPDRAETSAEGNGRA